MKYIFDYQDENDFKKKEKTLKKYNKRAYKELLFEVYPKLKENIMIGKKIKTDKEKGYEEYELELPTDNMFKKVHGPIKLHYVVYPSEAVILLTNITPEKILEEAHKKELSTYKGVMISSEEPDKDKFKVELLNALKHGN